MPCNRATIEPGYAGPTPQMLRLCRQQTTRVEERQTFAPDGLWPQHEGPARPTELVISNDLEVLTVTAREQSLQPP